MILCPSSRPIQIVKDISCVTPFGTSTDMQSVYLAHIAISELRCALTCLIQTITSSSDVPNLDRDPRSLSNSSHHLDNLPTPIFPKHESKQSFLLDASTSHLGRSLGDGVRRMVMKVGRQMPSQSRCFKQIYPALMRLERSHGRAP
jgi:hypothetical protein